MSANAHLISVSKEISAAESIRKNYGTSHGYGLIALSMIDVGSAGLRVLAKFHTESHLQDAAEQMLNTIMVSRAVRTEINEIEINGRNVKEIFGFNVRQNASPSADFPADFNGATILMKIVVTDKEQNWMFYKLPERIPRTLTLQIQGE